MCESENMETSWEFRSVHKCMVYGVKVWILCCPVWLKLLALVLGLVLCVASTDASLWSDLKEAIRAGKWL